MEKITLPTNYRDDILNSSAEGKRKYIMSYNQDGTVSFEDVTPYEQVGSDFGAGDINTANEAINESFDKNKLVKDLDTINALTKEGFAPDALAVKQLNESLEELKNKPTFSYELLATCTSTTTKSFTVKSLANYNKVLFVFTNNVGQIQANCEIPTGLFKTNSVQLFFINSANQRFTASCSYSSDTKVNMSTSEAERALKMYGIN